jgi:hypothetical protein
VEQKWGTFAAAIHHQDLHDVALIASRKHFTSLNARILPADGNRRRGQNQ